MSDSKPTIAYDARPLQPQTRYWGPGVVIDNILSRLSADCRFIGLAHRFARIPDLEVISWPTIPKTGRLFFDLSPWLAGSFDVYWGTNHLLPGTLRGPSLVTAHDLLFSNRLDESHWHGFLARRFRSSVRRAKRIVADSRTTANDLLELFPDLAPKLEVVLLGFDSPPEYPIASDCRKQVDRPPYLIMLGAHAPRKNFLLAAAAVRRLAESGIRIRLLVTGNLDTSFEAAAHGLAGSLETCGVLTKEKVFALLRHAVALLFPSMYEGFGFPPLEAMAVGCPVLALDTPINREIGGEGAWYLPADPEAWSAAIIKLMGSASAASEMREKGLDNLRRFSWDKTASQYGQLFRQLIA
jgi:glycosyltransferase involved in cell wall biosynthesis